MALILSVYLNQNGKIRPCSDPRSIKSKRAYAQPLPLPLLFYFQPTL